MTTQKLELSVRLQESEFNYNNNSLPYSKNSMVEDSAPFNLFIEKIIHEHDFHSISETAYTQATLTDRAKVQTALASLLWNLYKTYKAGDGVAFLRISMNENHYLIKDNPTNPLKISIDTIKKVKDHLVTVGLCDHHNGHYDGKKGRQTRIRSTMALTNHFENPEFFPDWLSENYTLKSTIVVKDFARKADKKRSVVQKSTPETPFINAARTCLTQHFGLLVNSKITIEGCNGHHFSYVDKDDHARSVDTRDVKCHAVVFPTHNGTTDDVHTHGRMYGGFWIGMPSRYREKILINGSKIAIHDFSGIIANVLASKRGIQMGDDPYAMIPSVRYAHDDDEKRRISKLAMVIVINSKTRNEAISGLAFDLTPKNSSKLIFAENRAIAVDYITAIEKAYPALVVDFYKSLGNECFKTDGIIARKIMQIFIDQGIAILPIHDAFAVPEQYSDYLVAVMKRVWNEEMGTTIGVKCESGPTNATQINPETPILSPVKPVVTIDAPVDVKPVVAPVKSKSEKIRIPDDGLDLAFFARLNDRNNFNKTIFNGMERDDTTKHI